MDLDNEVRDPCHRDLDKNMKTRICVSDARILVTYDLIKGQYSGL